MVKEKEKILKKTEVVTLDLITGKIKDESYDTEGYGRNREDGFNITFIDIIRAYNDYSSEKSFDKSCVKEHVRKKFATISSRLWVNNDEMRGTYWGFIIDMKKSSKIK